MPRPGSWCGPLNGCSARRTASGSLARVSGVTVSRVSDALWRKCAAKEGFRFQDRRPIETSRQHRVPQDPGSGADWRQVLHLGCCPTCTFRSRDFPRLVDLTQRNTVACRIIERSCGLVCICRLNFAMDVRSPMAFSRIRDTAFGCFRHSPMTLHARLPSEGQATSLTDLEARHPEMFVLDKLSK